jgi:enoyl-CoA hydratase
MGTTGKLPVADERMHQELTTIWRDVSDDPETRVAVIRGSDKGFSGGGSIDMVQQATHHDGTRMRVWREARDLVYNMINCSKPVVAAVTGPAVGVGLAVTLLADISVVAKNARLIDGHTKLGITAGDHSALIWPLLCGIAKAKYFLLLGEDLSGEEAERIGLVSTCVDQDQVHARATEIAKRLAAAPADAVQMTKHSLNHWLRAAGPIFEASLGMQFLNFTGTDIQEGIAAVRERRSPHFGIRGS